MEYGVKERRISAVPPPKSPPRDLKTLVEWRDLLPWQQDNEYIITHYRQASSSFVHSIKSILRLHNETVNIWTHGLGTLAFSLIPSYIYLHPSLLPPRYISAPKTDLFTLGIFFFSVTVCFLFSTSFHTFMNHSPQIWRLTSHLDHLGIVLVIWGSTIPNAHFGHYCAPALQHFYWNFATLCALLCALATLHPRFRTPRGRKIRVFLYMLLGASAFVPAVHGVILYGYEEQDLRMGLSRFIGLGVLNGSGAAIYGARIPERWWPRKFDVWGSSHQIMHVLVMAGAWCYGVGLVRAFEFWNGDNLGAYRTGKC